MPKVTAPDGTTINFPDGTDQDTMNSVMSDYWAKNGPTLESKGRLGAGRMSGALQGALAGFGDEAVGAFGATVDALTGGLDGKTWSERYGQIRDYAREDFDQYRQDKPWESFGVTALSGIVPALLSKGKTVTGGAGSRAVAGAKTGALWGGVAGFGSGEGDPVEGEGGRIAGALTGIATGGALGAVADVATPYVVNAVKWLAGRLPTTFNASGQLTPEAQQALKQLNIDPAQVSDDVLAEVRKSTQTALNVDDLAGNIRMAEAKSLPVPVPQTRGMVTQDPSQQMFENQARQGGYGTTPQALLKSATSQSQDALRGNVPAIQGQLSGTGQPRVTNVGEGGQMVANRLQEMKSQADEIVNTAYEGAKGQGTAGVPSANAQSGGFQIGTKLVQEGFSPAEAPRVHAIAQEMEALGKTKEYFPFVRSLFGYRSRLTQLSQSSDRVEAKAAGGAVKAFDEWIGKQLDDALIQGDSRAVQMWEHAIGTRREVGRVFESNDLIETLTKRDYRSGQRVFAVAPEDAANVILGRSRIPNLSKQNLSRDLNRLKTMLRPESPEWNALREEVFLRFAQTGLQGARKGEETIFSGTNLAKSWDKANIENRNVLGILFTPQEKALISQYARVAQRTMTPVEGGAPLGSGMSNIQVLKKIGAVAFAGPRTQALLAMLPGVGKAISNTVAIPSAYRAVTPKAVAGTTTYPGTARGAALGVVPTQQ